MTLPCSHGPVGTSSGGGGGRPGAAVGPGAALGPGAAPGPAAAVSSMSERRIRFRSADEKGGEQ